MSELKNFVARWSRRKRAAAAPQTTHTSPCKGEVGDPGYEPGAPGGGQGHSDSSIHDPHPTGLPSPREAKPHSRRSASASLSPKDSGQRPPVLPLSGGGITASRELAFDPAQLPPIESIAAESDIRAFLAPGVPAELTRAALRRAWAADPKIRDFVGLAENAWDFNAAGAMPGFGPLEMTEDLRRHIAQLLGDKVAGEGTDTFPPLPLEVEKERAAIEKSAVSNAVEANVSIQPPAQSAEAETSRASSPQQASQRDEVDASLQGEPKPRNPNTSSTKKLHGRALPK